MSSNSMAFLQDITLGKYIAHESPLHRLDPRTKFISVLALMATVFSADGFAPLALFFLFLVVAIALSGLPVSLVLKNLRPFAWLFIFTFVLHAILTPGTVLWRLPYFDTGITTAGLLRAAFFCLRLSAAIITASLLTLTTSPAELTEGLEKLLNPLRRIGLPAHELAMMATIALRFVPVLVEEAERLYKAQLARGASFGGNPIRRARSLIPLLVPLFVSAFVRADRLALAMESRCYRGGVGRTSFRPLRFAGRDRSAALAVLTLVVAIICLSRLLP